MSGIGTPKFSLVDQNGEAVNESAFPGKFLLVYFGFTHCRVVCPRSLSKLSVILSDIPSELLTRLKPLYITVDPDRDTVERMKEHVETNYPLFTGLTGTTEQIDQAKKAFRVFAQRKADPEDPDGYAVPHTAISYLINPQGEYETHWVDTKSEESILADLQSKLANISSAK